jgi:feruloyl-CoA synthase
MKEQPPVILDWLPWSHVFGGSFAINTVLRYAGTLFIDDGKPSPADIGKTLRNIRDVSPTLYWNVPKGYELLIAGLRSDQVAARSFFDRLSLMFYAGASLSPRLWDELVALGKDMTGRSIPMTTSWGLTETAPSITMVNSDRLGPGNIGIPMPGLELKMVPAQGKYEARVRGPTVMTGYFRSADASAAAFDEEGFFKTGDAIRLAKEDDASQGVMFDGRVAEDFKLTSGTWVDAAAIRLRALQALAGHALDVVVTGEDRHDIGLLIVPLTGIAVDAAYRERVAHALSGVNRNMSGSSQRIVRALVLRDPPAFDAGEITEKGSLNARLIRQRRRELIEGLHQGTGDGIIRLADA